MTVDWTGPNREILRHTLIQIYSTPIKLAKFVSGKLDKNLNEISAESGLDDRAFELIEEAVSGGWINDLYDKFCTVNQSNPRISQLKQDLGDTFFEVKMTALVPLERVIGDASSRDVVVREPTGGLVEDPRSAHLVIAVFWEKLREQIVQVQPKLCYRDGASHKISQKSLLRNDSSVAIKDFPQFLEDLVNVTYSELLRLLYDPIQPWTLTIALFVPIDLLCFPLSQWCGQESELLTTHAFVVGCSDRFDQRARGSAANLYNQMQRGWQRFQTHVPDHAGLPLTHVNWLNSDAAHQVSFVPYSGFQCYGDWLKPDEPSLKNWEKLVRSGIPLALWMCEGQLQRPALTALFDRLTNHNRFEFLEQIPIIRDEQQSNYNCVGVFYEDPNYVPDVSRTEAEQFFSWPSA